ncbi:MAG: hypothetical protein LBP54_02880 [Campylobacteraceae bacterium]|nr:hypothetical protein [Campylobacteraceae bacterium]
MWKYIRAIKSAVMYRVLNIDAKEGEITICSGYTPLPRGVSSTIKT